MAALIERMMHYVTPELISLTSPRLGIATQLNFDAPFRLYGIAVFPLGGGQGANIGTLQLRFTRPDRSWMQRHLMPTLSLAPFVPPADAVSATFPSPNYFLYAPIYPNLVYAPGDAIVMDIQRIDGTAEALNSVIVYIGCNIYEQGRVWAPSAPDRITKSLPFFGYAVQCNAIALQAGPVLDVPLNIQNDADFIWQNGVHTDTPPPPGTFAGLGGQGPDGNLINLGVRVRDYTGKWYSNAQPSGVAPSSLAGFVPAAVLFGFNGAELPGLIYPEIYIPKNQAIYFDFAMLDGTLNPNQQQPWLTLRGQKIYSPDVAKAS